MMAFCLITFNKPVDLPLKKDQKNQKNQKKEKEKKESLKNFV